MVRVIGTRLSRRGLVSFDYLGDTSDSRSDFESSIEVEESWTAYQVPLKRSEIKPLKLAKKDD